MRERGETHVITDLQQIKALADPLRQRILGAFVAEPRTTKQVAMLLGQPPTKLYHHVDLLEKAGLIELVETRPKRGTTEKYFQAIAHRFTVGEESLGGESGSVIEKAFAEAFSSAQREIRRAVDCGMLSPEENQGRAILALGALRVAPDQLTELQRRIADIAKELGSEKGGEREPYRLLIALYPSSDNEG